MAAALAALFALFWISTGCSILLADYRARKRAGPLSTPSTRISELKDGDLAKLVGHVRLGETVEQAPISGRPCAGYRLRVDTRRRLRWRSLRDTQRTQGFFLEDESGEVFIPAYPCTKLLLATDRRFVDRPKRRGSRAFRKLIHPFRSDRPTASMRGDEATLLDGSRIAVYGIFRERPAVRVSNDTAYRERAYQFTAEPADEGLLVCDKRGVLDSLE